MGEGGKRRKDRENNRERERERERVANYTKDKLLSLSRVCIW